MSHRVAILAAGDPLAALLRDGLARDSAVAACETLGPRGEEAPQPRQGRAHTANAAPEQGAALRGRLEAGRFDTVIYPAAARGTAGLPDPGDAAAVLTACREAGVAHAIVLSSAAIHAPSHKHPGRASERYGTARAGSDALSARWRELELAVEAALAGSATRLTILRPATVLYGGADDYLNRVLSRRLAATLAGHDPTMQFLSPEDLVAAVSAAITSSRGGVFQIAPAGAVSLHRALRLAGVRRLPLPRWLHRVTRALAAPLGLTAPQHRVDRLRHCWTVNDERARRELRFAATHTSAEAVRRMARPADAPAGEPLPAFDEFGLDPERIAAWQRGHIRFEHDFYWRIEVTGTEHLPATGAAVAVGVHRGFMPFDGVMALHAISRATGRYPRFLIHPSLVKFPFLANYMYKLGGVMACRENADYLLERGDMVAVFPEGIRGAFTYYRDAYRIGDYGRPDYVRMALRHRAPILPFVTVGSAEIFPILAKIDWGWWKRFTEWPCLPITPTFPLLPLPLPSKWHTRFMAPLSVHDRYPPEAAGDPEVVARIDREVRSLMAAAIDEMLARRRSVWHGAIFADSAR